MPLLSGVRKPWVNCVCGLTGQNDKTKDVYFQVLILIFFCCFGGIGWSFCLIYGREKEHDVSEEGGGENLRVAGAGEEKEYDQKIVYKTKLF